MEMRVLVVSASRHEGTRDIAAAIAGALGDHGVRAEAYPVESAPDPAGYDAVVLGSAVYLGRWLEPARRFAGRHAETLRERPVWLFSSGPVGRPPKPVGDPGEPAALAADLGARGHAVFPGRLVKRELSLGEWAVVRMVRAPEGDFRDWDAIADWGAAIADELVAAAAAA